MSSSIDHDSVRARNQVLLLQRHFDGIVDFWPNMLFAPGLVGGQMEKCVRSNCTTVRKLILEIEEMLARSCCCDAGILGLYVDTCNSGLAEVERAFSVLVVYRALPWEAVLCAIGSAVDVHLSCTAAMEQVAECIGCGPEFKAERRRRAEFMGEGAGERLKRLFLHARQSGGVPAELMMSGDDFDAIANAVSRRAGWSKEVTATKGQEDD